MTLVDAQTVATRLGVTRSYVYEHAGELGAWRLPSAKNGAGKGRLRFDLEEVERRLSCYAGRESMVAESASQAASRPRRRPRAGTSVELLPIRRSSSRG